MVASDEPAADHNAAIVALLEAGTPYTVYVGEVTTDDPAYPYLVVWPAPGVRSAFGLSGYGGEVFTTTQVTAAGLSPMDVAGAADRASAALHRVRPVIEGRRCSYIEQDPEFRPPPPIPDPQVRAQTGRTVYSSPMFFNLQSSEILH